MPRPQHGRLEPDTHAAAGHVLICFNTNGTITFFPETADPQALARALHQLVHALIESPSLIGQMAGVPATDA